MNLSSYKKVTRPGLIEIDPHDDCLLVHCVTQILDRSEIDPSGNPRVVHTQPRTIRINLRTHSVASEVAIKRLAQKIVTQCKYIHPAREESVLRLLSNLDRRRRSGTFTYHHPSGNHVPRDILDSAIKDDKFISRQVYLEVMGLHHQSELGRFREIDLDGDGVISASELRRFVSERVGNYNTDALFAAINTSHSGEITLDQFICWVHKNEPAYLSSLHKAEMGTSAALEPSPLHEHILPIAEDPSTLSQSVGSLSLSTSILNGADLVRAPQTSHGASIPRGRTPNVWASSTAAAASIIEPSHKQYAQDRKKNQQAPSSASQTGHQQFYSGIADPLSQTASRDAANLQRQLLRQQQHFRVGVNQMVHPLPPAAPNVFLSTPSATIPPSHDFLDSSTSFGDSQAKVGISFDGSVSNLDRSLMFGSNLDLMPSPSTGSLSSGSQLNTSTSLPNQVFLYNGVQQANLQKERMRLMCLEAELEKRRLQVELQEQQQQLQNKLIAAKLQYANEHQEIVRQAERLSRSHSRSQNRSRSKSHNKSYRRRDKNRKKKHRKSSRSPSSNELSSDDNLRDKCTSESSQSTTSDESEHERNTRDKYKRRKKQRKRRNSDDYSDNVADGQHHKASRKQTSKKNSTSRSKSTPYPRSTRDDQIETGDGNNHSRGQGFGTNLTAPQSSLSPASDAMIQKEFLSSQSESLTARADHRTQSEAVASSSSSSSSSSSLSSPSAPSLTAVAKDSDHLKAHLLDVSMDSVVSFGSNGSTNISTLEQSLPSKHAHSLTETISNSGDTKRSSDSNYKTEVMGGRTWLLVPGICPVELQKKFDLQVRPTQISNSEGSGHATWVARDILTAFLNERELSTKPISTEEEPESSEDPTRKQLQFIEQSDSSSSDSHQKKHEILGAQDTLSVSVKDQESPNESSQCQMHRNTSDAEADSLNNVETYDSLLLDLHNDLKKRSKKDTSHIEENSTPDVEPRPSNHDKTYIDEHDQLNGEKHFKKDQGGDITCTNDRNQPIKEKPRTDSEMKYTKKSQKQHRRKRSLGHGEVVPLPSLSNEELKAPPLKVSIGYFNEDNEEILYEVTVPPNCIVVDVMNAVNEARNIGRKPSSASLSLTCSQGFVLHPFRRFLDYIVSEPEMNLQILEPPPPLHSSDNLHPLKFTECLQSLHIRTINASSTPMEENRNSIVMHQLFPPLCKWCQGSNKIPCRFRQLGQCLNDKNQSKKLSNSSSLAKLGPLAPLSPLSQDQDTHEGHSRCICDKKDHMQPCCFCSQDPGIRLEMLAPSYVHIHQWNTLAIRFRFLSPSQIMKNRGWNGDTTNLSSLMKEDLLSKAEQAPPGANVNADIINAQEVVWTYETAMFTEEKWPGVVTVSECTGKRVPEGTWQIIWKPLAPPRSEGLYSIMLDLSHRPFIQIPGISSPIHFGDVDSIISFRVFVVGSEPPIPRLLTKLPQWPEIQDIINQNVTNVETFDEMKNSGIAFVNKMVGTTLPSHLLGMEVPYVSDEVELVFRNYVKLIDWTWSKK